VRGASAQSLSSVLNAVDESRGDLGTVGDELFAVAGALDATAAVRRMLTDPATESEAASGLAGKVFGGKVDAATLAIIDIAARGRWSRGRDLSDALELAGVAAHVAAADRANSLDAMEKELFDSQQLIDGERELRGVLSDRTIAADRKAELVQTVFGGKVQVATLALLKQAAAARTGTFDKVLAGFGEAVAQRRERTLAVVRTAYPLDDAELERLGAALAKKYGTTVHLNTIVDPTIVGGLKVSIGDDVIDGTISGRIEDARRQLAG
jgi:F-type H+-transporting ATPase subunit delta